MGVQDQGEPDCELLKCLGLVQVSQRSIVGVHLTLPKVTVNLLQWVFLVLSESNLEVLHEILFLLVLVVLLPLLGELVNDHLVEFPLQDDVPLGIILFELVRHFIGRELPNQVWHRDLLALFHENVAIVNVGIGQDHQQPSDDGKEHVFESVIGDEHFSQELQYGLPGELGLLEGSELHGKFAEEVLELVNVVSTSIYNFLLERGQLKFALGYTTVQLIESRRSELSTPNRVQELLRRVEHLLEVDVLAQGLVLLVVPSVETYILVDVLSGSEHVQQSPPLLLLGQVLSI